MGTCVSKRNKKIATSTHIDEKMFQIYEEKKAIYKTPQKIDSPPIQSGCSDSDSASDFPRCYTESKKLDSPPINGSCKDSDAGSQFSTIVNIDSDSPIEKKKYFIPTRELDLEIDTE